MPDTVIFKYEQPSFWYFTSKNGEILRKSKKNLNTESIEKRFLHKVSDSGIVAYFIYQKSPDSEGGKDGVASWK